MKLAGVRLIFKQGINKNTWTGVRLVFKGESGCFPNATPRKSCIFGCFGTSQKRRHLRGPVIHVYAQGALAARVYAISGNFDISKISKIFEIPKNQISIFANIGFCFVAVALLWCVALLFARSLYDTCMRKRNGRNQKASSTLRSSRAVPHPSTNRALRRLTSEFGRDPVHSTRYGRWRQLMIFIFEGQFCNNSAAHV
jgi:hypothetical protein